MDANTQSDSADYGLVAFVLPDHSALTAPLDSWRLHAGHSIHEVWGKTTTGIPGFLPGKVSG